MGVVAGMCFLLILLSSLNWVRRNHFELFYKTHIVCALLSFWSLYNHFELGKLDVAAPFLVLMLGDYLLRAWRSFRGDATIISTKVFNDGPDTPQFLAIELSSSRFRMEEAGQYFFIRIPSVGEHKRPLARDCSHGGWVVTPMPRCVAARTEWHPFSVSSAPEEDSITIVLKDLGDWTSQLCSKPERHLPPGSHLRLDGPYGRLAVPLPSYDAVLLCCGGIGCTPMIGVLNSLVAQRRSAATEQVRSTLLRRLLLRRTKRARLRTG